MTKEPCKGSGTCCDRPEFDRGLFPCDPDADYRDPSAWILTHTGRQFWPFDARPADLAIEDIAHALSHLCRFTGHTREAYSVAQHSVLVADLVPDELKLTALLHDASEAYLNDLSTPVKRLLGPAYRDAEARLSAVIAKRYGAIYPWPTAVHDADRVMLATERRDLLPASEVPWSVCDGVTPTTKVVPWMPWTAKKVFLGCFKRFSYATFPAKGKDTDA